MSRLISACPVFFQGRRTMLLLGIEFFELAVLLATDRGNSGHCIGPESDAPKPLDEHSVTNYHSCRTRLPAVPPSSLSLIRCLILGARNGSTLLTPEELAVSHIAAAEPQRC
jgi:hypothetical protein